MSKRPTYSFLLALVTVLALALFSPTPRSSAKGPKPIPPDCVSQCVQLLNQCFVQYGVDDNHCISVYYSCIPHCK